MKKTVIKVLSILLTVIVLMTAAPLSSIFKLINFNWLGLSSIGYAFSANGKLGDAVNYTFDKDSGLLLITGSGDMYNFRYSDFPFGSDYGNGIKSVVIEEGITSIGNYTFKYCSDLIDVSLPNSLLYIGVGAFSGCSELQSVTIPSGVSEISNDSFVGCLKLKSVILPNDVTYIGLNAFSGCEALSDFIIPNSVNFIGDFAFSGCSSLSEINIPESVLSIGNFTFENCVALESIIVPKNVESIGIYAFPQENDFIPYCYENSYAESYFEDYSKRYLIIWDSTDDSTIFQKVNNKLSFEIDKATRTLTVNCLGMISVRQEKE